MPRFPHPAERARRAVLPTADARTWFGSTAVFAGRAALTAVVLGGCLSATPGQVAGDTVDAAATPDTTVQADANDNADTAVVAEDSAVPPADGVSVPDATPVDTVPNVDVPMTDPPCCLVPSGLAGGSARPLGASACAEACGEPADATVCATPPRCCLVPAWQDDTGVMTADACAERDGDLVDDSACPAPDPDVCCRWTGRQSVELELPTSTCASTGGHEVIGDFCWDQVALGSQCCLLPDGQQRIVDDYQCTQQYDGQVIGRAACWRPPETGTCCALPCAGPLAFDDLASCRAAGGTAVDWERCGPPTPASPSR